MTRASKRVSIKRLMTLKVALRLNVECKTHGFSARAQAPVCGARVCVRVWMWAHAHGRRQAARFLSNVHGASNVSGKALQLGKR